MKNSSIVLVA